MNDTKQTKLSFRDVLIQPQKSSVRSRQDVSLACTYEFLHATQTWSGIPIIASNMRGVGTPAMAKTLSEHHLLTALDKQYELSDADSSDSEYTIKTIGVRQQDRDWLENHQEDTVRWLCIDAANGYIPQMKEVVKKARKLLPDTIIIAGNVVTPERTTELLSAGADIIKVGIGPGGVCTTRTVTGVGYPQISAVKQCSRVAHKSGGLVCADGGCRQPGDMAKAFAAGADFVMLGSMLAGHDQSQKDPVEKGGEQYVRFYGSSSQKAMERSDNTADYRAAEGKTVWVEYKGDVGNTVNEILGGLRSTCSYVGAQKLGHLADKADLIRTTTQHRQINDRG
jgi:GMP reductase